MRCDQAGPVTFASDIAPIVFEHCVSCHRTGGSAPFSLLSYEDVKTRAERIAAVTQTGYMPPWKPEPGYGDFADARRLSPPQIELIRRWVDDGAPLGDPSLVPPPPHVSDQWQLGTPDLVVTMDDAFTVPGTGDDVYRHFVIPIPLSERKFVSAWELRAGNSPVASSRHDGDRSDGYVASPRHAGPGAGLRGADRTHHDGARRLFPRLGAWT